MGCSSSQETVPPPASGKQNGTANAAATAAKEQPGEPQKAATPPPPQQPPPQQPPPESQPHNPPPVAEGVRQLADDETDIEVKHVKVDRSILERYIELEKLTHALETKNVIKNLQVKDEQLQDMNRRVAELDAAYRQRVQQTAKEKADVENMSDFSVQQFYRQSGQDFNAQLSKEQEEYVDALNQQEIAQKELEGVTRQRDALTLEVSNLQQQSDTLQKYYKEQDELLAGIFDGKYGSEHEYELEAQLDMLLDRKQRIGVARYKWQNSRVLLQHACNQMAFAVKRWQDVLQVPPDNMQQRYMMVTEARNNLIAANQNVTAAQRYLANIEFPYCKPAEMATLTKATNNIYTDMQTMERHAHAHNCYSVTHKRAAALQQWFDHVINGTILKDLEAASDQVRAKERELRKERLMLIKLKIKESGNDDNIDAISLANSLDLEDGPEEEIIAATMTADSVDGGDLPGQREEPAAGLAAPPEPKAVTPMPDGDLAATPNQKDLFGTNRDIKSDIEDLKRQHDKEMEEFARAQDINKTRMEAGLQEKLRARRSKRHRQAAQEAQAAQLGQ